MQLSLLASAGQNNLALRGGNVPDNCCHAHLTERWTSIRARPAATELGGLVWLPKAAALW